MQEITVSRKLDPIDVDTILEWLPRAVGRWAEVDDGIRPRPNKPMLARGVNVTEDGKFYIMVTAARIAVGIERVLNDPDGDDKILLGVFIQFHTLPQQRFHDSDLTEMDVDAIVQLALFRKIRFEWRP